MIAKVEVRRVLALYEKKLKEERQSIIAEMDRMSNACTTLAMKEVWINSNEYLKLATRLATLNEVSMNIIDIRCDEMFADDF